MPRDVVILIGLAITIPLGAYALLPFVPPLGRLPGGETEGSIFPHSPIPFQQSLVGLLPQGHPRITNVQIADLNQDGQNDVIVCDASRNAVLLYQWDAGNLWNELTLLDNVPVPSHATIVDLDGDDDLDVIVSLLGNIEPDDGVIGSVVLLDNTPEGFHATTILDDVRRVADVQPGDFDGDGDTDLAVAVFGYNRGQVLWLENRGDGNFREHELHSAPGIIHVPVADFDLDGDLDIAAIVTQDEEELWAFENVGNAGFNKRRLWFTVNFDLGGAGLIASDLDKDGDMDLILPAGDNLEDLDPYPQPWHGCLWFENTGNWDFRMKRIADLGGTYAAATGDFDADDDIDVVLVSMANIWDAPGRASIVWLENDGKQQFRTWQIDDSPTHLVTVAVGDLNGDGYDDIVAGGLHIRGPYDRIGRVTAWVNTTQPGQVPH